MFVCAIDIYKERGIVNWAMIMACTLFARLVNRKRLSLSCLFQGSYEKTCCWQNI